MLLEKEEPGSAEPVLRECLEIRREALPEGHWLAANTESILGGCLTALERYAEAEPLLLESYPVIKAARGESHQRTLEAGQRVVDLYEAWGQPDEADQYGALLAESGEPQESPAP